ncbi:hypothetical protein [Roseateles puraquae]|uniref:hypothetical protein n=1 Tax=Roseateles puraquae TaxID=431059 RepID=UPI0031D98C09
MEQPTITTAAFAAKLKDARHRKDQLSGERFSEGELDLSRNIDLALQRLQRDLVALDGADTVAPDGASSSAELGRRVVVASSLLVLDTRFASDIDRPLRLLESCALNITRAFGKDFNPMLQLLGLEPLEHEDEVAAPSDGDPSLHPDQAHPRIAGGRVHLRRPLMTLPSICRTLAMIHDKVDQHKAQRPDDAAILAAEESCEALACVLNLIRNMLERGSLPAALEQSLLNVAHGHLVEVARDLHSA